MPSTKKTTARKSAKTAKPASDAQSVSEFMAQLQHPRKAEIEALRQIILGASDQIGEEIKWNAPSFHVGEHFATFNLRSDEFVMVIFHTGAKVKDNAVQRSQIDDPSGLLEWIAADRAAVKFYDMAQVAASLAALQAVTLQWVRLM